MVVTWEVILERRVNRAEREPRYRANERLIRAALYHRVTSAVKALGYGRGSARER
jgi:hypothetical protein